MDFKILSVKTRFGTVTLHRSGLWCSMAAQIQVPDVCGPCEKEWAISDKFECTKNQG